MLEGDVDLPGVGKVDKRVLLGVGGVAAVFVGWKWWQARNAEAYDAEGEPVDPGFEDGGLLPGVAGAVRPDNDYGIPGEEPSTDDFGFTGKTNSQWTQYVTTQLVQSDRWSYTDIVTALGQFLANKPLTTTQVAIVQAAIALAGYPPQGSHVIIPGGNVPVLVAPTGLSGTALSDTQVSLKWSAVAGADEYEVYRGSAEVMQVSGTSATVSGLTASTSYAFQVAAVSAGGQAGPKSSSVTVKTKDKPKTTLPGDTPNKPNTPSKPSKPKTPSYRVVIAKRGDTISKIAARYGKSWQSVWEFNLKYRPADTVKTLKSRGPNLIYSGTRIWVPK